MSEIRIPWPEWVIKRKIGNGSFGSVYEIEREDEFGHTEKAALKVISIPKEDDEIYSLIATGYDNKSITEYYQAGLKSIIDEYAMMTSLKSHPNIVSCEDRKAVRQENRIGWDVYIRMELLTPLIDSFKGKEFSEQEVIKLGKDLLNALKACHSENIIHRDIKPDNIFVTRYGEYKLGDFGVARIMSHTTNATKTGTPYYMAPEVSKEEKYGKEADIYSLGMVMYWLLNNKKLPFEPTDHLPVPNEKEEARLKRMTGQAVPDPIRGSDRLKGIVKKALAYSPKDRYESAEKMLEALLHIDEKEKEYIHPDYLDDVIYSETLKASQIIDDGYVTEGKNSWEKDSGTIGPRVALVQTDQEFSTSGQTIGPDRGNPVRKRTINEQNSEQNRYQYQNTSTQTVSGNKQTLQKADENMKLKAGSVVATGSNADGQCNVSVWKDITAISAGNKHTVYLKKDGTVIAVGNNHYYKCNVSEWKDIIAISAGSCHTVGLKKNGTVVATGSNDDGQCRVSEWKDIIAISAGSYHTVGLKKNGTVVAKGNNEKGQNDVSEWKDIIAISAGGYHTVGLRKNGTVVAIGYNSFGQCDVSAWKDIIAISAGDNYTVGLKKDGTVVAVGSNLYGQCDVFEWEKITEISAGRNHTVGLKIDGTVAVAGSHADRRCNVSDWKDIIAISAGFNHTVGLKLS